MRKSFPIFKPKIKMLFYFFNLKEVKRCIWTTLDFWYLIPSMYIDTTLCIFSNTLYLFLLFRIHEIFSQRWNIDKKCFDLNIHLCEMYLVINEKGFYFTSSTKCQQQLKHKRWSKEVGIMEIVDILCVMKFFIGNWSR